MFQCGRYCGIFHIPSRYCPPTFSSSDTWGLFWSGPPWTWTPLGEAVNVEKNWSLKKRYGWKISAFSTLTGCLGWSHYPHSNKISNIIEGLPSDKETDGNISYKSLQYHRGQIFSLAAPDPPWRTPERSTITETCRPCLAPDLLELLPVNHAVTILVELPEGGDNFLLACSLILIPESEYVIYGNVLPKLQLRCSADSNLSQLLASHSRKGFD